MNNHESTEARIQMTSEMNVRSLPCPTTGFIHCPPDSNAGLIKFVRECKNPNWNRVGIRNSSRKLEAWRLRGALKNKIVLIEHSPWCP